MPHTLWRCQNESCSDDPHGKLIFDFKSPEPICPKCGADGRGVGKNLIVKREEIHYLVIDQTGPIQTPNGRRLIACRSEDKKLPPYCTASRESVTCAMCMTSDRWIADNESDRSQDAEIVRPKG